MRTTVAERQHMAKVAEMPCVACGRYSVHVHHVHSDGLKRIGKDNMRVVPLCPECHQHGPEAVHKIGHAKFNALWGIDLMREAERLANV